MFRKVNLQGFGPAWINVDRVSHFIMFGNFVTIRFTGSPEIYYIIVPEGIDVETYMGELAQSNSVQ